MSEFGSLLSADEEQTRDIGRNLASHLNVGDVLALVGELGAGKTRFVQGIAQGLGVPADVPVTSPTFTLLAVYDQGRLPLYHFDLYRLGGRTDFDRIGAEEYLWGDGICVLEWAERAVEAMPCDTLWIEFRFDGDLRRIDFHAQDERWRKALQLVGVK